MCLLEFLEQLQYLYTGLDKKTEDELSLCQSPEWNASEKPLPDERKRLDSPHRIILLDPFFNVDCKLYSCY